MSLIIRAYRREDLFRDKLFDGCREEILEVYKANGFRKLAVASVYAYLEEKYGILPANEQSLRNYIGYLILCFVKEKYLKNRQKIPMSLRVFFP